MIISITAPATADGGDTLVHVSRPMLYSIGFGSLKRRLKLGMVRGIFAPAAMWSPSILSISELVQLHWFRSFLTLKDLKIAPSVNGYKIMAILPDQPNFA